MPGTEAVAWMEGAIEYAGGLALGMLTGLIPGIHPNTVISILSSAGLGDEGLAMAIAGLYPASLIASFIPSIFFGVPDAGSVAVVLPGQRMALQGKGIAALRAALLSAAFAALACSALAYPLMQLLPAAYGLARGWLGWILLCMSLAMISRGRRPLAGLAVFAVAGMLGEASLNIGMADPFLPLFSGLFALPAAAAYRKCSVPEQDDSHQVEGVLRSSAAGVVMGVVAIFIPGIGSAGQMASFLSVFVRLDSLSFLSAASAISVSQSILALASSASIGKERVGAIASLAGCIDIKENIALLIGLTVAGIALSSAAVYIMRRKAAAIASMDFSGFNIVLSAYLACVCLAIDGPLGLAVLGASACAGWAARAAGVERTTLMGAVIVPTLLLLFHVFI
jgi:putative membrane protein